MEQPKNDQPTAAGQTPESGPPKPPFWTRPVVMVIGVVLLAGILFYGLSLLVENFTHESTDDAFLDGNVVSVAPKASGHVKSVFVQENQMVKAGDLLLEIDPRDYEMQLAQKKAALSSEQANEEVIQASYELLKTQVASAAATAKQSEAEVAASQAAADQANSDLKRAEDLFQRKIISPQEYENAKTSAASADASLRASQEKTVSDLAKVDTARAQLEAGRKALDRAKAQAEQSGVDVKLADLNLSYTKLFAPQDGRATRKAVQPGDYVQVGQKLMALVPTNLWVTGNFKETQLKKIRVGQPATITIDSVSGEAFPGHVESIQAGSGAAFSLLPPENAVGNFVKVVQRVPVRIFFDSPINSEHVVGPGMSAEPSVRVSKFEVPSIVEAIAAIVLALVIGSFWRRAAVRKRNAS